MNHRSPLLAPNQWPRSIRASSSHRHGAILICVLVCMLVAGSLIATTTLSILKARREAKSYQLQVQAMQLLDAGVQRAYLGFANSGADYQGEEWALDSTEIAIPQTNRAVVTITVEQGSEGQTSAPRIAVVSVTIEAQAKPSSQESEPIEPDQPEPFVRLKRSLSISLQVP
ncbi:MAG: hypothetical protein ACE361_26750 [Aureliella sp.]